MKQKYENVDNYYKHKIQMCEQKTENKICRTSKHIQCVYTIFYVIFGIL